MNNTIHIIHPKDRSTDFLHEISEYLLKLKPSNIKIYRIDNRENHAEIFTVVPNLPPTDFIVFLGHGTSTALSGAITNSYDNQEFICENQLKIFKGKEILLLACRSNQYLKKYHKDSNLRTSIGFPNMITDHEEIDFHDDQNRISDITPEDIEKFRGILVDVIKYSLEDYIHNNLSVSQLYNRIKLRLNKKVISIYLTDSTTNKLPLGKMINDLVDDMVIFRNFHRSI